MVFIKGLFMSIDVKCGGCGKRYRVEDQFVGKRVRCVACRGVTVVPQPIQEVPDEADFDALVEMESTAPVDESVPAPAPRRSIPALSPRRVGSGFRLGFRLNRIVLAALVFSGVLFFLGIRESTLASTASSTPQAITCRQLEEKGPGDNTFVDLSGFVRLPHGFVYEYEQRTGNDVQAWKRVWMPVVAKDGAFAKGLLADFAAGKIKVSDPLRVTPTIKVVLKSTTLHSEAEAIALLKSGSARGLIVNQIESLTDKQLEHLQNEYRGTSFANCWIVEVGREPASGLMFLMYYGGGAALGLIGLVLMFKPD